MSLLSVHNLTKTFSGANGNRVQAVSDVTFSVQAGEVLGVVGESGCGKTTLGHAILRLTEPDSGKVMYGGIDLVSATKSELKRSRRDLQIIFQDPFGSLTLAIKLVRSSANLYWSTDGSDRSERTALRLLNLVGLPEDSSIASPRILRGSTPANCDCTGTSARGRS